MGSEMCIRDRDIDECSISTPCDTNAQCLNTPGSYSCLCNAGYAGNGTHCTGSNTFGLLTFILLIESRILNMFFELSFF